MPGCCRLYRTWAGRPTTQIAYLRLRIRKLCNPSPILRYFFTKLLQFVTNSAPQVLAVRTALKRCDFKCQFLHSGRVRNCEVGLGEIGLGTSIIGGSPSSLGAPELPISDCDPRRDEVLKPTIDAPEGRSHDACGGGLFALRKWRVKWKRSSSRFSPPPWP